MGVRRGRGEAVGDGPPERLGRLAGGGGGYGGRSRRAVGRHRRGGGGGGGGIVARAGDPLGRQRGLPERHLVAGEIETKETLARSPGRRHSVDVAAVAAAATGGERRARRWKWNHKSQVERKIARILDWILLHSFLD